MDAVLNRKLFAHSRCGRPGHWSKECTDGGDPYRGGGGGGPMRGGAYGGGGGGAYSSGGAGAYGSGGATAGAYGSYGGARMGGAFGPLF